MGRWKRLSVSAGVAIGLAVTAVGCSPLHQDAVSDLKPYDSQAKLILFPGGHHGLHGQNQSKVNADVNAWYQLYGEYGTAASQQGS